MYRGAPRRFLKFGFGSQKKNGKGCQPARSSHPSSKDDHIELDDSKIAAVKPKIEQQGESSYQNCASERRKGPVPGLTKVEPIPENFEDKSTKENKTMIEEWPGGNAEQSVFAKKLDFCPLEQDVDRLALSETASGAAVPPSGPLPSGPGAKRRMREDIIKEVKQKRIKSEREGMNPQTELAREPVENKATEEAKSMVKLETVGGHESISFTSKKGKDDEKEVKKETPDGLNRAQDSGVDIIYIDYNSDDISDDKGREDITHEGKYAAAAGSVHLTVEADRSEGSSCKDSVGLDGFITEHQVSVPMHPNGGTRIRAPRSGATSKACSPVKKTKEQATATVPTASVGNEGSSSSVDGRVTRSRGAIENNSGGSISQPVASWIAGRRQKTTTASSWLAVVSCERCAHDRVACYIKKEDRTCCRCQRRKVGCTLATKGSAKGRKAKREAEEALRKEGEGRRKREREEELEAIQSAIRGNGSGPVGLTNAVGNSGFDLVAAVHETERRRALMTTNLIGLMKDSLALRDALQELLTCARGLNPASAQSTVDVGEGREEREDEDEDEDGNGDKESEGMVEELIADGE